MKLTDRIKGWWNPPESPTEIAAEKRLDEVTREAAWDELDKGTGTSWRSPLGPLFRPPRREDPDHRGLRDAFREGQNEYEEKSEPKT
jgi:hypothetical protein